MGTRWVCKLCTYKNFLERANALDNEPITQTQSFSLDSSSSESDESESNSESLLEEEIEENNVLVGEIEWQSEKELLIDVYKDGAYKPKLLNLSNKLNELETWQLFFPEEKISYILACTNSCLRNAAKAVTENELYKFFGLMYAMCTQQLPERRSYWGTVSNGLFPAPKFGKRFGMCRQRFEEILMALSFTPEKVNNNDKWFEVRAVLLQTICHYRC